jgi:hypothetical protein
MANLSKEIRQIKGNTIQGLVSSVIFIRREMDDKYPRVPRDLGNLDASFFIATRHGTQTSGVVSTEGTFTGPKAGEIASGHEALKTSLQTKAGGYSTIDRVFFGFSANYAIFVHEMVGSTIKWKRDGSGPKFLETHVKSNIKNILEIVRKNVILKKR